jgi:hypothetical protein
MESHIHKAEYLGDSVYVEFVPNMRCITTNNGEGPTNTIYLEREVYSALRAYVQRNLAIRDWNT